MPSALTHLAICADAATDAGLSLDGTLGEFLLGAIAPDAWPVAGIPRSTTHFWGVEDRGGVTELRAAHPELWEFARAAGPARAFVAGYLCHLLTDEQWNRTIWRPFFGRLSPYKGSPARLPMQLALLAVLEQRLRDGRAAAVGRWLHALAQAQVEDWLPFLPAESLAAYRQRVLDANGQPSSAQAFVHFNRRLKHRDLPDAEVLGADLPMLMPRAEALVPLDTVNAFRFRATAACTAVLTELAPAATEKGVPLRHGSPSVSSR